MAKTHHVLAPHDHQARSPVGVNARRSSAGPDGDDPLVVIRRAGAAERDLERYLRRRRVTDNLLRFGVPLVLLCLWQVAAVNGVIDRQFWPAPTDVYAALKEAIDSGILQEALAVSLKRLFLGWTIGCLAGMAVGLLLGVFRPLRVAIDPIISALYTVPKLAILPLLLLVFGLDDTPIIILVGLSAFFIVVISTTSAVVSVGESYLDPARSFGASRFQTWRHVVGPAVLPEVFVSLRLAAGIAVLVLIGVEFVQGGKGLGWMIWNSWQLLLADRMYVGIVTVALIGVVFQAAIKIVGNLVSPWAGGDTH
jgi:ABC-type nitrate/sulfonate/bicarbonate transport system permease component